MSGSSYAEHSYTRCVVGINAGISISWAPDPDGSFEGGARHHRDEEAGFREQLERAAPKIEVMLDELEATGRTFTTPGEPAFHKAAQRGESGMLPLVSVTVHCAPALTKGELEAFVGRIAAAVAEPAPEPVVEVKAPAIVEPPRPWWKVW